MTKEQARILIENYEIAEFLENEEEVQCLEDANPELLEACKALHKFAFTEQEKENLSELVSKINMAYRKQQMFHLGELLSILRMKLEKFGII